MFERPRSAGCWPTPPQRHLLRAALLSGDAAVEAMTAWSRGLDLRTLDEGSRRLLPLLYRRCVANQIQTPLLSALQQAYRHSWSRNQMLLRRVARLVETFAAEKIDTLLLKGVLLALQAYDDPGERPMADVDVMVPPDAVDAAVALLRRLGWHPHGEPLAWPPDPLASWPFSDEAGHELDLHWRPFYRDHRRPDDVWRDAVPLIVFGVPTRALDPALQALHLLSHGIAWNPVPSIRWVADVAVVIRRHGRDFPWARLVEQAEQRGLRSIARRGLTYLADEIDVPVPREWLARLEASESRREQLAIWARTAPGAAAGACRLWFDYREYAAQMRGRPRALGFIEYVSAHWQVNSPRRFARVVAQKVRARRAARAAAKGTLRGWTSS